MDQTSERRLYPRSNGQGPLLFADYGTERYQDAQLVDFGIGGLAFATDKALEPGGDVCVRTEGRLAAGYGAKLAGGLRAEVVWCRRLADSLSDQYRVGVEYYEPALKYQDRPWRRAYSEAVPRRLTYENTYIPEYLARTAGRFPHRMAISCGRAALTYAELEDGVGRLATCLTAFGIQKGDHVAVCLARLIPAATAYSAILKIGAVAVLTDPGCSNQTLAGQFRDVGVRVLICQEEDYGRMLEIRRDSGIRQIILSAEKDYAGLGDRIWLTLSKKKPGGRPWGRTAENIYCWKRVMGAYSVNPPNTRLTFQDQALCLFTPDAKGRKRRIHWVSHGLLSRQIQQLAAWFSGENEKILSTFALYEVHGLIFALFLPLARGWQTIMAPMNVKEGRPLPAAITRMNLTLAYLSAHDYADLLHHPDFDDGCAAGIKIFMTGQRPLPMEFIRAFAAKTGRNIISVFGLDHLYPVTHLQPLHEGLFKAYSIGIPVPDLECRIVDPENGKSDVPVGKTGELVVKSRVVSDRESGGFRAGRPGRFAGTAWLRSGRMARMDEDGFFYLV